MLKKLHVLLLVLLAAVCFTATAWADYDYIEQYGVMVTPNTEDGSLLITVKLEWTPLEELPYGQELKIGVPNGSIRDVAALTDNIERLDFDNSYMYVYLDRAYEANETFSFAYSWVQEYMYQLSTNGVIEDYDNVHYDYVTYDYTAGWFDEARIGQMTLIWNDPAGLTGDFTEGTVSGADSVTVQNGMTITASDLDYGYKMNVQVRYTDWPTQLSEEYSADTIEGLGILSGRVRYTMMKRHNSFFLGTFGGMEVVGFKSLFGFHYDAAEAEGWFDTVRGVGRTPESKPEGFRRGGLYATALIGPLLILNPPLCKWLLRQMGAEDTLAFEDAAFASFNKRVAEFKEPGRGFQYS